MEFTGCLATSEDFTHEALDSMAEQVTRRGKFMNQWVKKAWVEEQSGIFKLFITVEVQED